MMNSLFAGVSGLRNHQIRMNVIGNNIANINTTGFKSSRVTFEEALAQTIRAPRGPDGMVGGINPMQSGLGVSVSSIDSIFTQGSLESTGQVTDLAIEGNGFFILSDGENRYYSRAGVSQFDSEGNLVNPNNGFIVQGMLADSNGEITSGSPITDITLPFGQKEKARATTSVELAGNLDASPAKQTWTASSAFTDQGEIAAAASEINNLDQVTVDLTDGDQIVISGTKPSGSIVSAQFTYGAGNDGTTLSDLLTAINTAYGGDAVASLDASGNLVLTDAASGTSSSSLSLSFTDVDGDGSALTLPEFTKTVTGKDTTHATSIAVYDSLGEKHTVTITFTKSDTTDALWTWEAALSGNEQILQGDTDGDGQDEQLNSGTVRFNTDGSFKDFDYTDYADGTEVTSFVFSPGNGAENVSIEFSPGERDEFGGLIQFASSSAASAESQNGYGEGSLSTISIDETGQISGLFTNGVTRTLAQIALADFNNPSGLLRTGDNLYQASANSGQAVEGVAGTNIQGRIISGSLELSNVDLAQEFANMIIAQRGFQANARVITTTDDLLSEVNNLKR